MSALVVPGWLLIGLALGIWRINDFCRRLGAKYGGEPVKWGPLGGVMLVMWLLSWPTLILLDEWSTRRVLRRRL